MAEDAAVRTKEQERRRKQMREWRAANPDHARSLSREVKRRAYADPERRPRIQRNARITRIIRKFGIERDRAEALVDACSGRCVICDRPVDGRDLHLDHCHETGRIRGWLCGTCNSGIGQFRDRPDLLRAAAEYVERFR